MWVLYVGAAKGSALSVAVCLTSLVSVLYVSVCLCYTCPALIMAEHANWKAAVASLSMGKHPGS